MAEKKTTKKAAAKKAATPERDPALKPAKTTPRFARGGDIEANPAVEGGVALAEGDTKVPVGEPGTPYVPGERRFNPKRTHRA